MSNNKKGFTLIELIITIAIFSIVILVIFSMFLFENKVFKFSSEQFNAQSDVRFGIDSINKKIRYATELTILKDLPVSIPKGDDNNYIYFKDGTVNFSIYDASKNTRTNTLIGSTISSSSSYFKKINNTTIQINLTGTDNTNTYSLNSKIILKNFLIANPIKNINLGEGVIDRGSAVKYK